MTKTKSRLDIAQECRELSDRMLDLATDFDYYVLWKDHANYIITMASHLSIYARQLEAKNE